MEEPEEDFSGELTRLKEKQDQDQKNNSGTMAALLDSAMDSKIQNSRTCCRLNQSKHVTLEFLFGILHEKMVWRLRQKSMSPGPGTPPAFDKKPPYLL